MVGIVIEDGIENALILPIVDDREHTVGPLIELISRHVARKRRKCPVQKRAVHLPVRLFFPRPRSNFGWWQKTQTRGDRATGASWRGDTARHLQPPGAPPAGSPDGCSDHRAAPHH